MTNGATELVSVQSQLDVLEKQMLDGSFGPALQRTYEMLCAREQELMHRAPAPGGGHYDASARSITLPSSPG